MAARQIILAGPAAALGLLLTACGSTSTTSSQPSAPATASATSTLPGTPATASATSSQLGASAAASATSAQASVPATASPTAALSACEKFAATHTFMHLVKAQANADGSLSVTGNAATMVCGGPDDFHYDFGSKAVTGHVSAAAAVTVLNSSMQDVPITHVKFPAYLAGDMNVKVFTYTGPRAAISAMAEQFHP